MIKRILAALALLIVCTGGGWLLMHWTQVRDFSHIISSYYAKEMCTCVFVIEQKEETCHNIVRQYVPISEVVIDREQRAVTTTGLFQSNRAHFVSAQLGCTLEGPMGGL